MAKKNGRPSKVLTISEADVKKLAKIGCTQEEIGEILGVAHSQISRSFAQAYKSGLSACKMSLRRKQLAVARKGNPALLIWLGKQMLGQKDKQEITGDEGGPIVMKIVNFAGAAKK
jgi:hypothetical protein